jgi:predicted DNA-binding protein (MmcQ/YjbR family)
MDADQARTFLLSLPHVVETMQWGDNLVYWVGDKAIGGKMFALVNLDDSLSHGVVSYSAGPERYAELLEVEGLYPAPYMARIHWIAAGRWDVLRNSEWKDELRRAHAITLAKLPPKVHKALALPPKELRRLVAERSAIHAEKEAVKSMAKEAAKVQASAARKTAGKKQSL